MEKPAISIIIPAYNVIEAYLNAAIDSVLNQKLTSFEIIIVDDGSDLFHRDIVNKIGNKDHRITVYRKENAGVSAARNYGVSKAKGKYIAFLDADDEITDNFFQEAYFTADKLNADIVYGLEVRDKNNLAAVKNNFTSSVHAVSHDWIKKYHIGELLLKSNALFGRGPYCRLIKSSLVKNILFETEVPIGEDVLWNLAIAEKAKRCFLVDSIWYIYYVRGESVTNKYDDNISKKLVPFYERISSFLDGTSKDENYYISRIVRDLERYIYQQYLGNSNNKDPFLQKWKQFNCICLTEPWSKITVCKNFNGLNLITRQKIKLVKWNLYFPYMMLAKQYHSLALTLKRISKEITGK